MKVDKSNVTPTERGYFWCYHWCNAAWVIDYHRGDGVWDMELGMIESARGCYTCFSGPLLPPGKEEHHG